MSNAVTYGTNAYGTVLPEDCTISISLVSISIAL